MAVAGVAITAKFEELDALRVSLKNVFSKKDSAVAFGDALEIAINPMLMRLREITPRGPTSNLLRAVNSKVKVYPRDGNAVGLVGYNRSGTRDAVSAQGGEVMAGTDRAFHQWWVEYGTKARVINKYSNKPYQRKSKLGNVHWVSGQNSYIASSYKRLGPFKILRSPGGEFSTDPQYQKAFFKKSSSPIRIPAMPAGGKSGRPPVQVAFEQTQNQVADRLRQELGAVLDRAVQKLAVRKEGSLSS
jgi:hypothetical protein